jgi:Domain of unknown function (DUF4377)
MWRMTRLPVLALASAGVAALALLAGCSSAGDSAPDASGEIVRMWVEPELVDCTGVGPMECLQVSYTEGGEPELFYDSIDGFTFMEGTAYVLDVEVTAVADPPADGSSLAYRLVEVVSEEPQ